MRATIAFASIFALATSVLAQETTDGYAAMSAPAKDEKVPAGETYEIKWDAGKYTGDATIELLGGKTEGTLQILSTISTVQVEADSYAWDVDCSLGEFKTYGLKIADVASKGAIFQYSFPFAIKKCKGGDDSSSSVSTSTSAAASSYPVETLTTSTSTKSHHSTSTIATETSTTVATTTGTTTATTFITTSAPSSSAATTSASVTSGTPTTTSGTPSGSASTTPVPTAGAARVGAGLALGLAAAVFAL